MQEDMNDVLVFYGSNLNEIFLSYVATASKRPKDGDRPILVLTFGHRAQDVFSIAIGGTEKHRKCPKLSKHKFNEALFGHSPRPNGVLVIACCFKRG